MPKFRYNGLHFFYDAGTGIAVPKGQPSPLNDPSVGARIINNLVESIDMTLIIPPLTVEFPHNKSELTRIETMMSDEGLDETKVGKAIKKLLQDRQEQMYGWSTLAMIAESHIAIHTFPEGGYLTADVYSCKEFDTSIVEDMLDAVFFYSEGYSDSEILKEVKVVKRSLDFEAFLARDKGK